MVTQQELVIKYGAKEGISSEGDAVIWNETGEIKELYRHIREQVENPGSGYHEQQGL